jgi:hypothetical protein
VADFDIDQPMRIPDALTRVMAGKPFAPEVGQPATPYSPFAGLRAMQSKTPKP